MMQKCEVLERFFYRIATDPGIDAGHISLFMALYTVWLKDTSSDFFLISSSDLRWRAKISSTATYFKKINYLKENGYIHYEPNHYSKVGSKVGMV